MRETPTIMESMESLKVVAAAGGGRHSLVATGDGRCWVFGDGDDAQLGIPKRWRATSPIHAADNDHLANGRIITVAASYQSSFAATGEQI